MGKTKGFEDYARTGEIRYPVHVYTRTAVMFWGTLWVPAFIVLLTHLKDGPLGLGVILGLLLGAVYYVVCLICANMFGRCNGHLVGSIDVYKDRIDLNTLTALGFSAGRTVSLEMSEFSGIALKVEREKGRFDDYIVTLVHGRGGDDVRLGEIDISGKQDVASAAIRQFADDINLPVENPELLGESSGRMPQRRASQTAAAPAGEAQATRPAAQRPKPEIKPEIDPDNYSF